MRTFSVPRRPSTRSGFTLLEVLLTSLLAAIVLVALWSLSDIYMRLFVIAQRKIDETQLVRGLTEHLFEDLSQVIQKKDDTPGLPFVPRPSSSDSRSNSRPEPRESSSRPRRSPFSSPSSSTPENGARPNEMPVTTEPRVSSVPAMSDGLIAAGSSTSSATASTSNSAEKTASEQMIPRFGLFGTSEALRLIVLDTNPDTAREPTDIAEVAPQPGSERAPLAAELRTIEYTYVEPDESTGDAQQHPPGLVRREWAWETWVGLRMLNQNSSNAEETSPMMPDGKLEWSIEDTDDLEMDRLYHVPSIVGIEFQYFDGEDWQDEWDSVKEQKLPVMVEVVFQIDVSGASTSSGGGTGSSARDASVDDESSSSSSGTTYRQLIHLPWSQNGAAPEPLDRALTPSSDFARTGSPRGGRRP